MVIYLDTVTSTKTAANENIHERAFHDGSR